MAKRKSLVSGRAWRLLRLALLWARKGGAFKRGLMLDLRTAIRSIGASGRDKHVGRIHYLEREPSFDETPVIHFKMHRPASMRMPRIPCITPSVVDDDDNDHEWICENKRDFFRREEREETNEDECFSDDEGEADREGLEEVEEEKGIDLEAEEFIARFYEQMKLQRQVSWLQYNEMLHRGMN